MKDKWAYWFLKLAKVVSERSKDPSTKVGAIIARPDKSICSVGFNGFPKQMPDNKEWYDNREEKYSRVVHAEVNAMIFAREDLEGYWLFTYPVAPCERCVVQLLQAGIKYFVFPPLPEAMKERWEKSINRSKQFITECGAVYIEAPWGVDDIQ